MTSAPTRFGASTLERWYYHARKAGDDPVSALERRGRSDAGQQPSLGAALRRAIESAPFVRSLRRQPATSQTSCDAIERLVTVADSARRGESGVMASAFNDEDHSSNDAGDYVVEMRLSKVAQRIWMTELANRIDVEPPWLRTIGETHRAGAVEHPGCAAVSD